MKRKRVLVLEDNEGVAKCLEAIVEKLGFEVIIVDSVQSYVYTMAKYNSEEDSFCAHILDNNVPYESKGKKEIGFGEILMNYFGANNRPVIVQTATPEQIKENVYQIPISGKGFEAKKEIEKMLLPQAA